MLTLLKEAEVRHVAYVPDAGHANTIEMAHADPALRPVVLTTEEEGIGYIAGAWLGGERSVLLMQSSGVGNCINTLALPACMQFPLFMLITMRGEWAELNQWQNPMGQATESALRLMGVIVSRADSPDTVMPSLESAISMTFDGNQACALLLGQRLIGRKDWTK